ncbi:MAG: NUDIX domain-containing protein [bacterium]|jgi:8-oxo-dGTP diphosphatase
MPKIIPNLSVDCVVFGFDHGKLNVLLTERKLKDPETGEVLITDYTVQGHHVMVGEDLVTAAERVLLDKTGLKNIYLEQFYTFGDLNRMSNPTDQLWVRRTNPDAADYVVSIGYYSLVDSSKVNPDQKHQETKWFHVKNLPRLGFDHKFVIQKALQALRLKLSREPIGFELLSEKFTLTELQKLYEAIFGVRLDRRNFRKKVAHMKYVIPLDEKQTGVAHKPAQVFIFSKDVYDRTKKEKLDFSI